MINTPPGTKLIWAKGKRETVSADFSLTTIFDTLALRTDCPNRMKVTRKWPRSSLKAASATRTVPLRLKLARLDLGHPCLANTIDYTREYLSLGTVNTYRGEVGTQTVMNEIRRRRTP